MKRFLAISKALGDPTRARALAAVASGELCVCQLISLFGLSPSTVSKHMSLLHAAGLVDRRSDGRWTYYRLAVDSPNAEVREAIRWTLRSIGDDATVRADAEQLTQLRCQDPADLTACYSTTATPSSDEPREKRNRK